MYPFFVALHVLLCVFLILIIMLQPGKGGDVGAAFGGGGAGSTMFGPRGPTNLLQQATTACAVMFMVTSITLALYSHRGIMADANVEDEIQRLEAERLGAGAPGALLELEAPAPPIEPVVAPAPVDGSQGGG